MKTYGELTLSPGGSGRRGTFVIDAAPHVRLRLKRVLSRVESNRAGKIYVTDTPEVARDLQWVFERWPMEMDAHCRDYLDRRAKKYLAGQEAVDKIFAGERLRELGNEPLRPAYDFQQEVADVVLTTGRTLCGDDLGLGKAQPVTANVLTPSGFVPIGRLGIGDQVITDDGSVTCVTGVFPQGVRDVYRVRFSDETETRCDLDHLWRVRPRLAINQDPKRKPEYAWDTLTLREILDGWERSARRAEEGHWYGRKRKRWFTPLMSAPDLGMSDLPLDPYIVGVLLGDGSLAGKSVSFGSGDREIADRIQAVLPDFIKLKARPDPRSKCVSYGFRDTRPVIRTCSESGCERKKGTRGLCKPHLRAYHGPADDLLPPGKRPHPIYAAVRGLGMGETKSLDKAVPYSYKWTTAANRLSLLQGLMDTDGGAPGGLKRKPKGTNTAYFYTSSPALADDVIWLARSLGGEAKKRSKFAHGRDRYTIAIRLPSSLCPFRLRRKANLMAEEGHWCWEPRREIIDIASDGQEECVCISVASPSKLYVTDDFVVTHNTTSCALVLRHPAALPALAVVPTHLPEQWEAELKILFPWLIVHIVNKRTPYDVTRARGMKGKSPDVLIITYSKLDGWADVLAGKVKTVLFDEMQELRRAGSQKYNAAAQVANLATYRMGATATPVFNYGGEMFNLMDVLEEGCLGTRAEFAREWGHTTSNGHVKIDDPQAFGTYLREQGLFVRRTRKDVGKELPPTLRIPRVVPSDYESAGSSDEIANLAEMVLHKSGTREENFKAAGQLDLQMRRLTGVAKAPYVADFIRLLLESEDRVVVWAWHRSVYEVLLNRLRDFNPVMYTGSESPVAKRQSLTRFKTGEIDDESSSRVLLMSLRSGAGIDGLEKVCKVGVFAELDWAPGTHDQAIGRLARGEITDPVLAYFLVSDEGSDPLVSETLGLKRQQSAAINDPTDSPLLASGLDPSDRMRKLAIQALRKHRPESVGMVN